MKYIKVLIVLISLFFYACSDRYEQRYENFADYNKINLRNKSWFPDFVASDAYDLKNDSYLDQLCTFGTFSYSENKNYDSIFAEPNVTHLDFTVFKNKVTLHKERRPSWFLKTEEIVLDNFESIKINRFYITRDKAHKKIYYILCN